MHPRLRLLHAVGGHAAVPHCGAALLLSNKNVGASKEGCRRLMLFTQQRALALCIQCSGWRQMLCCPRLL